MELSQHDVRSGRPPSSGAKEPVQKVQSYFIVSLSFIIKIVGFPDLGFELLAFSSLGSLAAKLFETFVLKT